MLNVNNPISKLNPRLSSLMKILTKITVLLLFIPSKLFCQVEDSTSISDEIDTAQQISIHEDLSSFYVNEPNQDAMDVFTKFISCFRFPDMIRSSAPIKFTALNFKGVKSVKVTDDAFSVPTYYAEFDTAGRYKKINYYEVYADPPYYTLEFDYTKKDKFAEVINTYDNKNEIFLEFYAKEDTIIFKREYPSIIYKDAFDIYKRAMYDYEVHAFDKAKATALDKKEQYCIRSDTHCTYSTLSDNVYQYDYSFDVDGRDGCEIIYFNSNNQLVKVELYEISGSKQTISIEYKYYNNKQ